MKKCRNYYTELNNIPIKEYQNNYMSFHMKERKKFCEIELDTILQIIGKSGKKQQQFIDQNNLIIPQKYI